MTGSRRDGKRTMTVLSITLMAVGLCILGMASFSSENVDQKRRYLAVKRKSHNKAEQKINTRSPDGNEANPLRRLETDSSQNTERRLAVTNPPPASDIIPSEYIVTVATGRNMPKADVTAAVLISTYGGTLMATYDQTIKGFSAILTEAQAAAMAQDADSGGEKLRQAEGGPQGAQAGHGVRRGQVSQHWRVLVSEDCHNSSYFT